MGGSYIVLQVRPMRSFLPLLFDTSDSAFPSATEILRECIAFFLSIMLQFNEINIIDIDHEDRSGNEPNKFSRAEGLAQVYKGSGSISKIQHIYPDASKIKKLGTESHTE